MNKPVIYSVGHLTHQLNFFLELLKVVGINCIDDIRSAPISLYNLQFKLNTSFKTQLEAVLKLENNIDYAKNKGQEYLNPFDNYYFTIYLGGENWRVGTIN